MGCGSAKTLQSNNATSSSTHHDSAVPGPSHAGVLAKPCPVHQLARGTNVYGPEPSRRTPVEAGLVGGMPYFAEYLQDNPEKTDDVMINTVTRENPYHEVRLQSSKIKPSRSSDECSSARQYPDENFRVRTSVNGSNKIRVTLSSDGSMLEIETEKLDNREQTIFDSEDSQNNIKKYCDLGETGDYVYLSQEPGVSGLSAVSRSAAAGMDVPSHRRYSYSSVSSSDSDRTHSRLAAVAYHHQPVMANSLTIGTKHKQLARSGKSGKQIVSGKNNNSEVVTHAFERNHNDIPIEDLDIPGVLPGEAECVISKGPNRQSALSIRHLHGGKSTIGSGEAKQISTPLTGINHDGGASVEGADVDASNTDPDSGEDCDDYISLQALWGSDCPPQLRSVLAKSVLNKPTSVMPGTVLVNQKASRGHDSSSFPRDNQHVAKPLNPLTVWDNNSDIHSLRSSSISKPEDCSSTLRDSDSLVYVECDCSENRHLYDRRKAQCVSDKGGHSATGTEHDMLLAKTRETHNSADGLTVCGHCQKPKGLVSTVKLKEESAKADRECDATVRNIKDQRQTTTATSKRTIKFWKRKPTAISHPSTNRTNNNCSHCHGSGKKKRGAFSQCLLLDCSVSGADSPLHIKDGGKSFSPLDACKRGEISVSSSFPGEERTSPDDDNNTPCYTHGSHSGDTPSTNDSGLYVDTKSTSTSSTNKDRGVQMGQSAESVYLSEQSSGSTSENRLKAQNCPPFNHYNLVRHSSASPADVQYQQHGCGSGLGDGAGENNSVVCRAMELSSMMTTPEQPHQPVSKGTPTSAVIVVSCDELESMFNNNTAANGRRGLSHDQGIVNFTPEQQCLVELCDTSQFGPRRGTPTEELIIVRKESVDEDGILKMTANGLMHHEGHPSDYHGQ